MNVGLVLPLCSVCTHTLQPRGVRAVPCPAEEAVQGCCGTNLCPAVPAAATASLGQGRDGQNPAASSPDRNLLVLSFTPAHKVIPQGPLAEERLEEQRFELQRGSTACREKVSSKAELRAKAAMGTAKGCAGWGQRDRLVRSSGQSSMALARPRPCPRTLTRPCLQRCPPSPRGTAPAGCESTHRQCPTTRAGPAQPS